ncbi:MAG TPA: lytic transglycosylase domain-containing protein [Paraburkholderia sp.]
MASTYLPISALAAGATTVQPRRAAGVVMMIGGMADDAASSVDTASAEIIPTPDDDDTRLSVVLQPGSSPSTDTPRPMSASVAARVMAFAPVIDEAAHAADVDRALLMAMIDVESAGDPQAVSAKGATGLMQLMPGTGERHGASNLFDPRQNVAAGARYLKELTRQFGELPLALAAYNAGEGAVRKYGGQIPPYAETMAYVPEVIARYTWYRAALSSTGGASIYETPGNTRGRLLLVRSETGH